MQDVEILSWFSESRSRSLFRTKSSTIFQSKIQHLLLTISIIAAQKHFRNNHRCILCFTMSAVETTVQTREARSHHYIDEQSKILHCSLMCSYGVFVFVFCILPYGVFVARVFGGVYMKMTSTCL